MIRNVLLLAVLGLALHGRPGPFAPPRPTPRIMPSAAVARDPDLALLWRLLDDLSRHPDASPETRAWAATQRDTMDALYGSDSLDPGVAPMIPDLALGAFALVGALTVVLVLAGAVRRHAREAEMREMGRDYDCAMVEWNREEQPR